MDYPPSGIKKGSIQTPNNLLLLPLYEEHVDLGFDNASTCTGRHTERMLNYCCLNNVHWSTFRYLHLWLHGDYNSLLSDIVMPNDNYLKISEYFPKFKIPQTRQIKLLIHSSRLTRMKKQQA